MRLLRVALSFCLLLGASGVYAQSARQYISTGDEAMQKGDCYNAAEYYRQGLEKFEFNIEMKYK